MKEVLDLIFPFLVTTKNYAEMIKKLASFAFWEIYIATFFLRGIPWVGAFFERIEKTDSIGKGIAAIPTHDVINISGIVIAFAGALLTAIFQFHDKISDLLGIRRRFDTNNILIPLAILVGSNLDEQKKARIAGKRDELMRAVFYKYASSASEKPLVDKHDIQQAMNAWSWYWVFVEASFYFAVFAVLAWRLGGESQARSFWIVVAVSIFMAFLLRLRLGRYAKPEIDAIAADASTAIVVKAAFDAI